MSSTQRVLSEDDPGVNVEVLDGLKLMSPRPALPHTVVASQLGAHLQHHFNRKGGGPPERPGGWIVLYEPELHLDGNVLIPDLAGWKRERFALVDVRGAAARVAPDWVCEILSESTEKIDRQRKVPIYHRYGVEHLWLVDPLLQTVEVFRRSEQGYVFLTTHIDHEVVHAEPFHAVAMPLMEIWPDSLL